MRVTIDLPDALVAEAKVRAAAEGRTVTSLVEEGLRMLLADGRERLSAEPRRPLPTFGDRDDRFLVDPSDREALWSALDADAPITAALDEVVSTVRQDLDPWLAEAGRQALERNEWE
jgi:hypothetical protein